MCLPCLIAPSTIVSTNCARPSDETLNSSRNGSTARHVSPSDETLNSSRNGSTARHVSASTCRCQ